MAAIVAQRFAVTRESMGVEFRVFFSCGPGGPNEAGMAGRLAMHTVNRPEQECANSEYQRIPITTEHIHTVEGSKHRIIVHRVAVTPNESLDRRLGPGAASVSNKRRRRTGRHEKLVSPPLV